MIELFFFFFFFFFFGGAFYLLPTKRQRMSRPYQEGRVLEVLVQKRLLLPQLVVLSDALCEEVADGGVGGQHQAADLDTGRGMGRVQDRFRVGS